MAHMHLNESHLKSKISSQLTLLSLIQIIKEYSAISAFSQLNPFLKPASTGRVE